MMNKEQKKNYITEMTSQFENSKAIMVTHYQGLTMTQLDELRSKMREHGIIFKITKNRITKLALEKTKCKDLSNLFTGPTAVAFGEDAIMSARILSKFAKDKRKWCICKIPPTYAKREIEDVIALGYKQIHASNTLRCARGGISGRKLVPYTLKHIDFIKKEFPHVEVIAGGGVYNKEVVNKYLDHGADHISFGTICFKPWKIKELIF